MTRWTRRTTYLAEQGVLASVLQTCRRQGRDILGAQGELLREGPGHVIHFAHTKP